MEVLAPLDARTDPIDLLTLESVRKYDFALSGQGNVRGIEADSDNEAASW